MDLISNLKEQGIDKIYVKDELIYLPFAADSEGNSELRKKKASLIEDSELLTKKRSAYYVKALTIRSIINNAESTASSQVAKIDIEITKSLGIDKIAPKLNENKALEKLIFEIAPFFAAFPKDNSGYFSLRDRVMMGIEKKYGYKTPKKFKASAEKIVSLDEFTKKLSNIDKIMSKQPAKRRIANGEYSTEELDSIINSEIKRKMLIQKRNELKGDTDYIKSKRSKAVDEVAMLLYLNSLHSIKLGDFTIRKSGGNNYIASKETGPYALMDFDGSIYKFSSARVGVEIEIEAEDDDSHSREVDCEMSEPLVINRYKHPFLPGYESNQSICIQDNDFSNNDLVEGVVERINAGINTLLYGYFNRENFAGYISLDGSIENCYDESEAFKSNKVSKDYIEKHKLTITNKHLIKL